MASQNAFEPLWASAPGETISDILRTRRIDFQSFAADLGESEDYVKCLLVGACPIDRSIAERLQFVIGGSVGFWLRREAQYREDVARLEMSKDQECAAAWLKELPLKDMRAFGWIRHFEDKVKQANECLRFFGSPNIAEQRAKANAVQSVVAFRTSQTFRSSPGAVAAWLRQGELLASKMSCAEWNREKFRAALTHLKKFTRIKEPAAFVPALQNACAECGVAVVILQAPQGCRTSGATRFISNNKAMLLLSFRYRSDDHFWFTFFHEAGHLVLHGDSALFIEGADVLSTAEEGEADEFSEQLLVPAEFQKEMLELPANYRTIMRFARKIGVSPGIVVGQLQHAGVFPREKMNFLKVRYVWA